jgi:hypothetical protein
MKEQLVRGGAPIVGISEAIAAPRVTGTSPWALAIATSVVGAAAGWVIEEVARKVRGRRKR